MKRVRSGTGLPITNRSGSPPLGAVDKASRRGVIGAMLMVVGLIVAVWTIASVSRLQESSALDQRFIGTGEGEGLELLDFHSHGKAGRGGHAVHERASEHSSIGVAATHQQTATQHTRQAAPDSASVSPPAITSVVPDPQDDQGHVEHHAANHVPIDASNPSPQGFYTLSAKDIDGKERHFSEFAGKVTLVVNVASQCGFTDSNYRGLNEVYDKYANYGLVILAFPCNQFGQQEPGSAADIREFCTSRYHVKYTIMDKVEVNGPNAHPVYRYLRQHLPASQGGGGGTGEGAELGWNFQKILVDRHGRPVRLHHQEWDRGRLEHDIYNLLVGKELSRL